MITLRCHPHTTPLMDLLALLMAAAVGIYALKSKEQRRRIALLGGHLRQYQIENLMERLIDGYLQALGENDPARREPAWQRLAPAEVALCEQFERFVGEFSRVDAAQARVSRLPLALPFVDRLLLHASFDLRDALRIHARGIADAAANRAQQADRDRAYTLTAELLLMQHSCHWFCRSRAVASARVLARHKTSHAQLLAAVAPDTRKAYGALTGIR
jgi:hypothetical protein